MVEEFRHGIETVEVDDGIRPIETGPSNIIGLIGTAPNADPEKFPINEPVLIAGNPRDAVFLGEAGTLMDAVDAIFDQFGADVIIVRVNDDPNPNVRLSNLIGSQSALTGVHAFKKARSLLKLIPKILIAPGFTAIKPPDGVASCVVNTSGANYTSNTVIQFTGGGGSRADAIAVVANGQVAAVAMKKKGLGYTTVPTATVVDNGAVAAKGTLTLSANVQNNETVTIGAKTYTFQTVLTNIDGNVKIGATASDSLDNLIAAINLTAGSGSLYATATTIHPTVSAAVAVDDRVALTAKSAGFAGNSIATTETLQNGSFAAPTLTDGLGGAGATVTAVLGTVANPVVAEMIGIAEDMRSIIIVDTPGDTFANAIAYRNDWDSDRLWLVEGGVQVWDTELNAPVVQPVAARLAGKQAFMDQRFGFWYSASNQPLNGVIGVNRIIDWSFFSSTVEGQLLNAQAIAVVVHEDGFRVLGTRSPTTRAVWKFLPVRRTADQVYDAIELAMREAIDKPISLGLLDWIEGSVNAKLRQLAAVGAIINGRAWLDKTLNPIQDLQNGRLVIDFDIEPPAPLERLTFRAHRNAGYYTELLDNFLRNVSVNGQVVAPNPQTLTLTPRP
jgi:uncharacterized protein